MIHTEIKEFRRDGERQAMPGFDPTYCNIVDYILKITETIWEQKKITLIYDTYESEVVMHSGRLSIKGVENIVNGTISTLASFPDRKMKGEAVIWSENGEGHFFTSHRICSTATNLGDTVYGKATGKKVVFRTIADCCSAENKIFEEWLVRDNLHLVQQLGFDAVEMAKLDRRYKSDEPSDYKKSKAEIIPKAQGVSPSNSADLILSLFTNVVITQNLAKLKNYYSHDSVVHAICENDLIGPESFNEYLRYLLDSFSNAKVSLERVTSNRKGQFDEVAARWTIQGMNDGEGFFGKPSGKLIVLPIISHYIVRDGFIKEEWMIFDGFDVLCQMYAENTSV